MADVANLDIIAPNLPRPLSGRCKDQKRFLRIGKKKAPTIYRKGSIYFTELLGGLP
jgi:hypothetical protein